MYQYVIKKGNDYLRKRKWNEHSRTYFYYYSDDLNNAIILDEHIALIWQERMLQESNEQVSVVKVSLEMVENTISKAPSNQFILRDKETGLFVKGLHFSPVESSFVGFRYTDKIMDAYFIDSVSQLQDILAKDVNNDLKLLNIIRSEVHLNETVYA